MKFVVSIFLAVTLTQCSSGVAQGSQESHPAPVETGAIQSAHGCTVVYERYKPDRNAIPPEVILAHGFMRKLDNMRGWARHWQQQGIPTTLVSLCNSSWLNGHHQRNADDMQALRRELEMDAVIYAGFSAGGLAAYLAAGQDASAAGYLGLDSVDSGTAAPPTVISKCRTTSDVAGSAAGPMRKRRVRYRATSASRPQTG